jgi:hypothetical protein
MPNALASFGTLLLLIEQLVIQQSSLGKAMQSNDPTPPKPDRAFSHPQVVTAIITGMVTVVVAFVGIVPQIVNNQSAVVLATPTVAPTVIVVTSTPVPQPTDIPPTEAPPSATPIPPTVAQNVEPSPSPLPIMPTLTPLQLTPNAAPTEAPVVAQPTTVVQPTVVEQAPVEVQPPANPPNVRILFDGVSLTLVNISGGTLSLVGVTFSSPTGSWDALTWGRRVYDRLPDRQCLRVREAAVGRRTPPAECVDRIFGLIEAGGTAMFWRGAESFNVERNGTVIATCQTAAGACEVYVPQS